LTSATVAHSLSSSFAPLAALYLALDNSPNNLLLGLVPSIN